MNKRTADILLGLTGGIFALSSRSGSFNDDAFGTWSKTDFLDFLDAVESKYGIKQAMIYESQYVPQAWL